MERPLTTERQAAPKGERVQEQGRGIVFQTIEDVWNYIRTNKLESKVDGVRVVTIDDLTGYRLTFQLSSDIGMQLDKSVCNTAFQRLFYSYSELAAYI
jgi:hypothetical protein